MCDTQSWRHECRAHSGYTEEAGRVCVCQSVSFCVCVSVCVSVCLSASRELPALCLAWVPSGWVNCGGSPCSGESSTVEPEYEPSLSFFHATCKERETVRHKDGLAMDSDCQCYRRWDMDSGLGWMDGWGISIDFSALASAHAHTSRTSRNFAAARGGTKPMLPSLAISI